MIWVQRAAVDGRDRACVDKGGLNRVVDEEEEKHCEGEVRERTCYCNASKSTDPTEYMLNTRGRQDYPNISPSATDK